MAEHHEVPPADRPLSIPPAKSMRRRIEDAIEALIAQLDDLEGDADDEDDGTAEWSLGWPEGGDARSSRRDATDCEVDAADEPDVSWREHPNQGRLSAGRGGEDDEPSLGSLERPGVEGSQLSWGAGACSDGEWDAGEEPEEENEHGGDILDEPHDFAFSSVGRVAAMPPTPYRARLDGRCLEPFIAHDSSCVVDPQRPFRPGDLVCVNRRAAAVPKGDHHSLAKIFGGESDGFVYLWMTNPPSILRLRAADILSMHRIVSVTQPNAHVFAPESVLPRLSQIIGIPHLA